MSYSLLEDEAVLVSNWGTEKIVLTMIDGNISLQPANSTIQPLPFLIVPKDNGFYLLTDQGALSWRGGRFVIDDGMIFTADTLNIAELTNLYVNDQEVISAVMFLPSGSWVQRKSQCILLPNIAYQAWLDNSIEKFYRSKNQCTDAMKEEKLFKSLWISATVILFITIIIMIVVFSVKSKNEKSNGEYAKCGC